MSQILCFTVSFCLFISAPKHKPENGQFSDATDSQSDFEEFKGPAPKHVKMNGKCMLSVISLQLSTIHSFEAKFFVWQQDL